MNRRSYPVFFLVLALSGCAGRQVADKTSEGMKSAYLANYPRLEPCYKAYGRNEPIQLAMKISVNSAGEVQFAEVDRENEAFPYRSNEEFDACAQRTFLAMRFAESAAVESRGYRATLPVVFPISK